MFSSLCSPPVTSLKHRTLSLAVNVCGCEMLRAGTDLHRAEATLCLGLQRHVVLCAAQQQSSPLTLPSSRPQLQHLPLRGSGHPSSPCLHPCGSRGSSKPSRPKLIASSSCQTGCSSCKLTHHSPSRQTRKLGTPVQYMHPSDLLPPPTPMMCL